MRVAVSTHLYHDERLSRDLLAEIAGFGFDAVELFAARNHFDYRDRDAVERLGAWLNETGLPLHAIHAPIAEGLVHGRWDGAFSTASADAAERRRAVEEIDAALNVARAIGTQYLVVHLGLPAGQNPKPGDNVVDAARRSLEELHDLAAPLGVRVAVEVIPNALSTPTALVRLLEEDLDLPSIGICLDFGHALLLGDPVDAIETTAGHIVTTHVHDNDGREDQHLVPYEGVLDWDAALTSIQKVGYEGALVLELAASATPAHALGRARRAREAFERALAAWMPIGGEDA